MKSHLLISLTLIYSLAATTSCSKKGEDTLHPTPSVNTTETVNSITTEKEDKISESIPTEIAASLNIKDANVCERGLAISNAIVKAAHAENCYEVSKEDLSNIKSLDLHTEAFWADRIQIKKISENTFEGMNSLEELDLSGNLIESINEKSFKNLKNLKTLNLSNNLLAEIAPNLFEGLKELNTLNLSKNKIKKIELNTFKQLISVKDVNLSENLISIIAKYNFKGAIELETLDLSKNKIKKIEANAFRGLDQISTLNLSKNPIRIMGRFKSGLEEEVNIIGLGLVNP